MGLAEVKRKQRLVGSARTNNVAWTNDATLPGQRLLASMGWQAGQGIGQNQAGLLAPVNVAFKMDNKGIGAHRVEKEARAMGKADAWIGGGGELGSLFDRLNAAASTSSSTASIANEIEASSSSSTLSQIPDATDSKKSKKEKKHKKEKKNKEISPLADAVIPAPVLAVNPRMAARARYLRAKRLVGNDLNSVNEILGIASPSGSNSPAPIMSPAPEQSDIEVVNDTDASESDKKEKKKKRKRDETEEPKKAKKAAKEEKRRLKEEKKLLKKEKKEKGKEEVLQVNEGEPLPSIALSDPSFNASGGGNIVSQLSVQQYLSNKLMLRKAEILRKRRAVEEGVWDRAATVQV